MVGEEFIHTEKWAFFFWLFFSKTKKKKKKLNDFFLFHQVSTPTALRNIFIFFFCGIFFVCFSFWTGKHFFVSRPKKAFFFHKSKQNKKKKRKKSIKSIKKNKKSAISFFAREREREGKGRQCFLRLPLLRRREKMTFL